jgi:hypothetical protein
MKSKKYLIVTLSILVLILAGCSKSNDQLEAVNDGTPKGEVKELTNKEFLTEIDKLNTYNQGTDLDKCNDLKDSNVKATCAEAVKYNIAVQDKDPSKCQGLESNSKKMECEMTIKSSTETQ